MNPDQIKQVVETIKTLNLNLNDATTQKIADAILPVVQYYLIFDLIKFGVVCLIVVLVSSWVYKVLMGIISNEKRNIEKNGSQKNGYDL